MLSRRQLPAQAAQALAHRLLVEVALRRWNPDGGFTSATYLLDRDGVVRFSHPGGRYSPSEAAALKKAVAGFL